jgi:hypothetical protein
VGCRFKNGEAIERQHARNPRKQARTVGADHHDLIVNCFDDATTLSEQVTLMRGRKTRIRRVGDGAARKHVSNSVDENADKFRFPRAPCRCPSRE